MTEEAHMLLEHLVIPAILISSRHCSTMAWQTAVRKHGLWHMGVAPEVSIQRSNYSSDFTDKIHAVEATF